LVRDFKYQLISINDLLDEEIDSDSEIAKEIIEARKNGGEISAKSIFELFLREIDYKKE